MEVSPFVISEELSRLSVNDDFFAIDFAKVERKLAVEFNGPSHYLHDDSENGQTKSKRPLLKALGWRVGTIHWKRWIKAQKEETDPRSRLTVAMK